MASQTIELIARGVLIHDHRLLLCQNRKHGHLFLPGGHVEFGEPATVALQREVKEELGIDLVVGPFLGACEASFHQRRGHETKQHHEINLVFELKPPPSFSPTDLRSQEDHIMFLWHDVASLEKLNLLPIGIVKFITNRSLNWLSLMQ